MKEVITTFKNNRDLIENFISSTVERIERKFLNAEHVQMIFDTLSCASMVYFVDEEYNLASPYFFKNKSDSSRLGTSKSMYFDKVLFNKKNFILSNPYISSSTGKTNVTFAEKIEGGYLVIDINTISLLERLNLIQSHSLSRGVNKFVYGFMGFSLLFFALFLGIYAIYVFGHSLIELTHFNLESTFKAIIALTLGLAIFDLSRTILEQEIFFKSVAGEPKDEDKVFSKFLISIIIALSIEALMVVFKIALIDYRDMLNALYLILGIAALIYALGKYNNREK